jgi:hypothetical protein
LGPPPAAMTTVVELFAEDRLAHPFVPHVFLIPRLMTHLWRNTLGKDTDLTLNIPPCFDFWPPEMHEPLILMIVLPCSYVPDYFGPWVAKGTPTFTSLESYAQRGLHLWRKGRPKKLLNLEGPLQRMWETPEEWLRSVLLQFLSDARVFPPCGNVWCGPC